MKTSEPGGTGGPDGAATEKDRVRGDADLVRRLMAGDPAVAARALALAPGRDDPALLVAAAVVSGDRVQLERASLCARTARDRQLVVLADAHLRGDHELFSVLVREHLSEYPDHVLAAWIAAQHT